MLFLDDFRDPVDSFYYLGKPIYNNPNWKVVRSYDEFCDYIIINGLPSIISFDHDLGFTGEYYIENNLQCPEEEKTGYDCAKWLVEYCIDNASKLPTCYCHSANPVGKKNVEKLLENYKNHEKS